MYNRGLKHDHVTDFAERDRLLSSWIINVLEATLLAVTGFSFNFSEHKKVLPNPSIAITNAMSSANSTYAAQ